MNYATSTTPELLQNWSIPTDDIERAQNLSGLSMEEITADLQHALHRKNKREEQHQQFGSTERDSGETVQFSARLTARIRFAEAQQQPPLFIDPYSSSFGGLGSVSSEYGHTHFLYRRMASQFKREGGTNMPALLTLYKKEAQRLQDNREKLPYVSVRTRIIDDMCEKWIGDVEIANLASSFHTSTSTQKSSKPCAPTSQLVLIGCGFDARAYRLPFLQNTSVFELDQKDVIEYKDSKLSVRRSKWSVY